MNGVHDLGGMHGFGPVEREENEPPFHAPWEATMVAIMRSALSARLYNIDEFRHGIERMDPAHYLGSSHFEHLLDGIARILTEKGVVTVEEMEARTAFFRGRLDAPATAALEKPPAPKANRGLRNAYRYFKKVDSYVYTKLVTFLRRKRKRRGKGVGSAPRFAVGSAVVARNMHPVGHTRLPRYARGKPGVIAAHRGVQVFPDARAHGLGDQPQHVYSVRFDARKLWGDAAEPNQHVYLDLWESYLLPG